MGMGMGRRWKSVAAVDARENSGLDWGITSDCSEK